MIDLAGVIVVGLVGVVYLLWWIAEEIRLLKGEDEMASTFVGEIVRRRQEAEAAKRAAAGKAPVTEAPAEAPPEAPPASAPAAPAASPATPAAASVPAATPAAPAPPKS